MIPFFVGYAMLVWYLSARYRRTVLAFACALSGTALLAVLAYGHWLFGQGHPELFIQGMQILLYPYTVVVGVVGVFIASLPRRYPPGACPRCGYDLAGLGHPVANCPECGRPSHGSRVSYRRSGAERENLRRADVTVVSAAEAAPGAAGDQDQQGDHAEQRPPDG